MKPRGLTSLQITKLKKSMGNNPTDGWLMDEINDVATSCFDLEQNLAFYQELISLGRESVAKFLERLATTGEVGEGVSSEQEIKTKPRGGLAVAAVK